MTIKMSSIKMKLDNIIDKPLKYLSRLDINESLMCAPALGGVLLSYLMDINRKYKRIIFTVLSLVPLALCYPAATHLVLTHVGPCEDSHDNLVEIPEMKINTQMYDSTISGVLNVSTDVEDGWKIKATLKKCQDIRNIDTCDYFNSHYLVRNGCSDDDADQEAYGLIFHYAKPEMDCPVTAGTYYLEEYPFFTQVNFATVSASKISTSVFGYMCVIEGVSKTDDKIFCAEAYLQLLYMRDHNWMEKINKTSFKNTQN